MKILSEVQLSASDDNAETAQSKVNCCNLEVFQILLIVVIIILQVCTFDCLFSIKKA